MPCTLPAVLVLSVAVARPAAAAASTAGDDVDDEDTDDADGDDEDDVAEDGEDDAALAFGRSAPGVVAVAKMGNK